MKMVVAKLIFAINLRQCDPIHTMRIISNFYEKWKRNEKVDDLVLEMEKQKNNIKNDIHSFEYAILIYLLSGRNKAKEPNGVCPCMICYTSRNIPFDEDLLRFNIAVPRGEFQ